MDASYRAKDTAGSRMVSITPGKGVEIEKCVYNNTNFIIIIEAFQHKELFLFI